MSRAVVSSLLVCVVGCHHAAPDTFRNAAPSQSASFETPSQLLPMESKANRTCSDAEVRAVLGQSSAPASARLIAWEKLASTCEVAWVDFATGVISRDGLRARIDFASALIDAGRPFDCKLVLALVTTPYSGGISDYAQGAEWDEDSLLSELRDLDERCSVALEHTLADFKSVACTDASVGGCFSIEGCTVEQTTGSGSSSLVASSGPLTDEAFCCGLDQVAAATRAGKRYLRVMSRGITRVCGGGTAASVPDAIYEVRGDQLVLVADYTIALH
jgi:hypothetical protein